ncbi:hypothetical protein F240042I4_26680 [Eisenbergiella tayi]
MRALTGVMRKAVYYQKCNLLFIKYMVRFINKALYQPLNRTVSVCPGGKSYIGVNYSGKTYMEGSCNGTI